MKNYYELIPNYFDNFYYFLILSKNNNNINLK